MAINIPSGIQPNLTIMPKSNESEKIAASLSNGLQALAEGKLKQISQRNQQAQTAAGLQALVPTMTSEQAQQLALLPPEILDQYAKSALQQQRENEFAQNFLASQQPQEQQMIPGQEGLSNQQRKVSNLPEGFPAPRNSREALELAKLSHAERVSQKKLEAKERADAFKATQESRKALAQEARGAKNTIHELDRLKELESEGLDTAGYYEFLKRADLDIPALMDPTSQDFLKIQQGFLRGAKDIFGARVSNYEAEQFLKAIPSLSQSPEGRKRVIANLEYIERGKLARFEAARDIIAKNKGIPPLDLDEQIEEQIGPKLDKLSQKFREDLKRKVPESQNKLITAGQALAGEALGALKSQVPKAAKRAVQGAIAGSVVPGLGTGIGAGLGGLYGLFE